MSRLLSEQVSKHKTERFFCLRCLNSFNSDESLQKHNIYCSNKDALRVVLPDKENNSLSFNNYNRSLWVPFVVSADFEAITEKLDNDKIPEDKNTSYTTQYEKHSPSGFCYYIKCSFDKSYDKLVKHTQTNGGRGRESGLCRSIRKRH